MECIALGKNYVSLLSRSEPASGTGIIGTPYLHHPHHTISQAKLSLGVVLEYIGAVFGVLRLEGW